MYVCVTFALTGVVILILCGINILQFLGHFHTRNYPLVRKKNYPMGIFLVYFLFYYKMDFEKCSVHKTMEDTGEGFELS